MHQQQPLDQYPDSLLQPHFDEEATLVSARPVVPLSVVRSRGRRRNLLMFGGAIALSILVGAVGGTFIYSQRNKQNQQTALSEQKSAAAFDLASGGVTPDEPSQSTEEAVTRADSPVKDQLIEIPEPSLETHTNRTNRAQLDKKTVELTTAKSSAHEQRQIKADPAAARQQRVDTPREERRPRRVDEAQSQMERNDSSDLFRIREIFEGPRSQRRRGDRRAIPY